MSAIWQRKKKSLEQIARDVDGRSPVFDLMASEDFGEEWRMVGIFKTHTLVKWQGNIERVGPVHVGIRYHLRHLSQAPDPFELVSLLFPLGVFHPNVAPSGAMCLGHPEAGISLDLILSQVWAGLNFNMKYVNTKFGDVANPHAAQYVRENLAQFPLSRLGLFETPVPPTSGNKHE